jgi:hypothetical protein
MADFKLNNSLRYVGSLVALAVAWTTTLSARPETLTLQGYVHAHGEKPLAGVLIRVTSTMGKSDQQTRTDDSGAYKFTTNLACPSEAVLLGSPHCNDSSLLRPAFHRFVMTCRRPLIHHLTCPLLRCSCFATRNHGSAAFKR